MRRLRDGKDALRQARRNAPLAEKLRQLVYAQHLHAQVVGSRRPLKPWQRPWDILSDVREYLVIKDDTVEVDPQPSTLSSSSSHWVRPLKPWTPL